MTRSHKHKKRNAGLILLGFLLLVILAQTWFFWRGSSGGRPLASTLYTIARDPTWYPFDFLGKETRITAFSDDLLFAIAKEEGFQVRIFTGTPTALFPGLNNGTYDGILTPESPRESFVANYPSSRPYFRFGPVLLVRLHSPITELAQLKGSAVGVIRGASLAFETTTTELTYIPYDNLLVALQNLTSGSLDGVVVNAIAAHVYTDSLFKGTVRIATAPLTDEGLRLFVVRGAKGQQLVKAFNQGLERIKANGTYEKLLKKWDLFDPDEIQALPVKNSFKK